MSIKVLYICVTILGILASSHTHAATKRKRVKSYRIAKLTSLSPSPSRAKLPAEPEYKSFEIRTAPLALLARWYTLDLSFRFTEKFATGPTAVWYRGSERGNMFTPSFKGQAYGWQANYYFNSVAKNSWYLSGRSYYESYRSYPHGRIGFNEKEGYRSNLFIGYQQRSTRFHNMLVLVGAGVEYRYHDVTEHRSIVTESTDSVFLPMIEFKIGFEF